MGEQKMKTEKEWQEEYQEYLKKCEEEGLFGSQIRSIHQFKNWGVFVLPVKEVKEKRVPGDSKADKARIIYFEEKEKGSSRKHIINRFMTEAELTFGGANTYYCNFQNKQKELNNA